METRAEGQALPVPKGLRNLLPTVQDLKDCRFAFVNGSVLGFLIGVLPGAGSTIASFISYGVEKAVSRRPEEFGKGAVEGVAAPEGANNSETGGALVPLLTLGIPGSGTTAVLLAALVLWGFKPGPLFISENPWLFWGLVASIYIGNVMLLVLNLPLVGVWIKLLAVPYRLLFPAIFVFCCIGAYAVDNKVFDVYEIAELSAVGYVLLKLDCEPAPMVLGYILGPMMEENLRRAMMISFGDPMVLITRPLSAAFLFAALALLVAIALPALRAKREEAMQE